ncbi:DUF2798 domain-containing protein [Microvirga pakistanensis]|uniref:DUF2798 domain-containing protein n=1 Tax=Microvirga pakistanensis TaxID=1682650 RepID=UPI00106BF948|nr:DUF2798 domain-containing protein [Microvirga pakistanensis]
MPITHAPQISTTLRPRKLPARAQAVVFPMILSLLMSGIVSTIATLRAVGITPGVGARILEAWGMSYVIAFPTALLVMPLVRRIVAAIVETPKP